MNHCIAVSALLALAGSSYGFVVNQFALQPGATLSPSSGSFVNYGSGYFLGPGSVVVDSRATWKNYGNAVLNTTWLAVDPDGGGPDVDAYTNSFSRVLAGLGGDPSVPEFSGSTANWLGTPGLLNDGSAIDGGVAGVSWGAGSGAGFNAPSAVTQVNGVSVDSLFWGYFVLTEPDASIVGTGGEFGSGNGDILMTVNLGGGMSQNIFLPLDGSPSPEGYAIAYERHTSPDGSPVIKAFVVIPAPGAMGVLGLAGLAAIRRRR